jgi:predicted DNA-binding protein (MmcQ/YjbR family)
VSIEELREISLKLNGVTEDIKWEEHLCFSVAEKMFLITSPDRVPPSATFKVEPEIFEELLSREGFSKDAHLGNHNWIHIDNIDHLSAKEWKKYILQSYQLVAAKLPVKKKKLLGIE